LGIHLYPATFNVVFAGVRGYLEDLKIKGDDLNIVMVENHTSMMMGQEKIEIKEKFVTDMEGCDDD